MNDVKEITAKNKNTISYIHVSTVTRSTEINPKTRRTDTTFKKDDVVMEMITKDYVDYVAYNTNSKVSLLVLQPELNDFISDLGLPKDGAEFTASCLKKRNLLKPNTKVSFYRNRDTEFRTYFIKYKELSLVHCTGVRGLM